MVSKTEYFKSALTALFYACGCICLISCAGLNKTDNGTIGDVGEECGEISVLVPPPQDSNYKAANIFKIGRKYISSDKKSYKLKPGRHTISMSNFNDILTPQLKSDNLTSYLKLKYSRKAHYKLEGNSLELEVKPNVTYHLAAESSTNNKLKIRKQENWSLVVWKTTESTCRL